MNFCELAIKRPVATIVVMVLLVVFGVICGVRLPVREYPDIDLPVISIRTNYSGASANIVEEKISQLIESAVSGIEGVDVISSDSSDGKSRVKLEFDIRRNIDAAVSDVRDQVSKVTRSLPDEADAPVVSKYDTNGDAIMTIAVTSATMKPMELTDYISRYLLDRFAVLNGVADAGIFRAQFQSMRVWLDRRAMAARDVTVEDIESALKKENVEYPAGRVESASRDFTVRINRNYRTVRDFRRLVIKRTAEGGMIRLADVARVELEPKQQREAFWADGNPTIGIAIYKQSKANTLAVTEEIKNRMQKIQRDLPEGMELKIIDDGSIFINAALTEVQESLLIAAALVLLIIFLFLGSFRASLVPAVTVPISLVSALIVLYLLGYSINLLTLLAMVLAIGLVVDDAIVMLENIHRRIEEGEQPLLAAVRGSRQVVFAIIATTLVLAAVFLPICMMEGKTGKLFTEFSVAITAAVMFSMLIALTLSPMMCSRVLEAKNHNTWLVRGIETLMKWTENGYMRVLRTVVRWKILSGCCFVALVVSLVWLWQGLPTEYEPQEDRAVIYYGASAPEGTGFNAMTAYADELGKVVYPYLNDGEVRHILMRMGGSGAVNWVGGSINLETWDKRKRSAADIADEIRPKLAQLAGVSAYVSLPGGILGGSGRPVQFVIGGPDYATLAKWRDIVEEKAKRYPGLTDISTDYNETNAQFYINVDTERAAELGVSAAVIGRTLETMLGSRNVTTFLDRGKEYDVILQANRTSRSYPADLSNIYVQSSSSGELVPLDNLVTIKERAEANTLRRYNRIRSITISANLNNGRTLEEALKFLDDTVHRYLPEGAQIDYKDASRDLKESKHAVWFVFVLALLVAYLVLAAQFESFISPLVVMLTAPLGLIGACIGLYCMGLSLNVYSQIGLIMLIGLAAKNGILIVEFANQLRDEGMEFQAALLEAARLRLRPILMTGIATVTGAIPLVCASGAGAASRKCLGTVIVGGGLSACMLTVLVVPLAYLIFCRGEKSPKETERRIQALEAQPEEASNP